MSSELELETMHRNPRDADGLLRRIRSSSEMVQGDQDDDLEPGSNIAFCRICFDTDQQESKLISPCMCKGTQQFVHRTCLDHWRSVKEGYAFAHCTTCRAQFHLLAAETEDSYRKKIKFRLFVARDVFLIFLAMQFVIGVIACAACLLDKHGAFQKLSHFIPSTNSHSIPFYYCIGVLGFYVIVGFVGLVTYCCNNVNNPRVAAFQNCCCGCGMLDCCPFSWPEACFTMIVVSLLILSILGIAYGFLVATFAFQRIWQRHFHILTKKELTKEYVVQDLGGSYFPPKLDLEHEIRLKMLKLL